MPVTRPGPPLPLLSQLAVLPRNLPDSPSALPPGWSLIEAPRLRKFGCYGPQYLALGARMNPAGRLCSGSWDVVYLNEPRGGRLAGLGEGLRVLLSLDDGAYCNLDFVHVQQACALMFEPRDRSTWTVLDGETVPDVTTFMEVHRGLCSILVSPAYTDG